MERIYGKYDDITNKSRPGSFWVSGFNVPGRTDSFRVVDTDGAEMHFEPVSRYYAATEIKRGEPVAIAQLTDATTTDVTLSDTQKANKYAYVKVADPDVDEICLGIAENYAEEGQIVHVRRYGKFNFLTTSSILYTEDRAAKEIFFDDKNFSFDDVRGQRVYLRKFYDNAKLSDKSSSEATSSIDTANDNIYDTDHTDNDKDSAAVDTGRYYTYDFVNSVYTAKNTFQIGYLTDAPVTDKIVFTKGESTTISDGTEAYIFTNASTGYSLTGIVVDSSNLSTVKRPTEERRWFQQVDTDSYVQVDEFVVTIELEVTGDTKGALTNTQFLLTLGEDVVFDTKKQDVTLTDPYNNEGVKDEIKVIAIAEGQPQSPAFRLFTSTTHSVMDLTNAFIGVRKLDGDTVLIPVCCSSLDLDALENANDEGYIKLSKTFTSEALRVYIKDSESVSRSPQITTAAAISSTDIATVSQAVASALSEVFATLNDNNTYTLGCEAYTDVIGNNGKLVTTESVGGYYDIYVSASLLPYITATCVKHGQTASAGQAILADIREKNRLHIAGIALSNQSGVHKKGSTIKVMSMGSITTLGNLKVGARYFLGLNGQITTREDYWYDHSVYIGTAESANTLIVDVDTKPFRSFDGSLPIGFVKPSVHGSAEDGFLLADGLTLYSKTEYPDLYAALQDYYSEEELKPSNVNEDTFTLSLGDTYASSLSELFTLYNTVVATEENIKEQNKVMIASYNAFETAWTEMQTEHAALKVKAESALSTSATAIDTANEAKSIAETTSSDLADLAKKVANNYYNKDETYTKSEITSAISTAISNYDTTEDAEYKQAIADALTVYTTTADLTTKLTSYESKTELETDLKAYESVSNMTLNSEEYTAEYINENFVRKSEVQSYMQEYLPEMLIDLGFTIVSTITLDTTDVTIVPNQSTDITATLKHFKSGTVADFTTTSSAIAAIVGNNNVGTVTGVASGTATITAAATDYYGTSIKATANITVVAPSIKIATTRSTLILNATSTDYSIATLSYTSENLSSPTVTYTIDNTSVATISNNTVTAVATGTVNAAVSAVDAYTNTVTSSTTINVINPTITLSSSSSSIAAGDATTVSITGSNFVSTAAYTAVSSDTSVATVSIADSTLTITGVSAGSAKVTVVATTAEAVRTETLTVTVTAAETESSSETDSSSSTDTTTESSSDTSTES